ncbi:MFS transporter [Ramlibacter sp. MAHUQ-53]|uniref:MFS transporter n=1 Tax=unclassified Ramlibacter TaxID=2617605 RepID=UPI0036321B74
MTPPPSATLSPADLQTAVRLLAIGTFFSGIALRLCDGLLPRLAGDFSISAGQAGQVVIAFSLAYSAVQLLFGPLGDRFGKARMVCLALLGCCVMSLLAALAPSFERLVDARVGWGMMAAGVVPLAMAWIGDAVPYEERQPTLAKLLSGTLSGMVAGQLAGGLFAEMAAGWRGAFGMMAVGYGGVGLVLLWRLRRLPVPPPASTGLGVFGRQLRAVVGEPWTWRVLGACWAEGVLLLGPLAFIPAMLHQRFGLGLALASGLVALYAAGGLLYTVLARRIVQRLGERRMVTVGGWLMGGGYLAWLLSPVVWTAAPAALVVGFGTYLFHNTLQTHATQMAPTARGTAVSLFAFSLFFGQAVGVTLAGYAFDHLGHAAMLAAPVLLLPLVGLAFAGALRRRVDAAD